MEWDVSNVLSICSTKLTIFVSTFYFYYFYFDYGIHLVITRCEAHRELPPASRTP